MRPARFPTHWLGALLLASACEPGPSARPDVAAGPPGTRLALGVGDRISVESDAGWTFEPDVARAHGVPTDLFAIWLTRGWQEGWVGRERLARMHERGITPVFVHYFFADGASRERLLADWGVWLESVGRLADLARGPRRVLIVLEPEFNDDPPPGETPLLAGTEYGVALREALAIIRERAPNAWVGTCPGDFPGMPRLERPLGEVASQLDFLAFQEMRARGFDEGLADYRDVAGAAVDYARYLKRAFGKPILLAYLAVSSHRGWEGVQAEAIRGFTRRIADLEEAGVFGLIYFALRDDPKHVGYFGAAERHFGLLRADATPKPALAAFRELAATSRRRVGRSAP